MTTREIYFKYVMLSDLPIGWVGYVCKDENNIIQIGKKICLELRTHEKTIEKSLKIMSEIENSKGFMFWDKSIEGKKFFNDNWDVISESLSNMILNQK